MDIPFLRTHIRPVFDCGPGLTKSTRRQSRAIAGGRESVIVSRPLAGEVLSVSGMFCGRCLSAVTRSAACAPLSDAACSLQRALSYAGAPNIFASCIPNHTAGNPISRFKATFVSASPKRFSCSKVTVSKPKVEKVVSAPKQPVTISKRHVCWEAVDSPPSDRCMTNPISRQPSMLTAKVPKCGCAGIRRFTNSPIT